MKTTRCSSVLLSTICSIIAFACGGEKMLNGERIIFLGDSITRQGENPTGYITLLRNSLSMKYPGKKLHLIGAGVDGDKVPDVQDRLETDVLSRKPHTVVVFIGVNDVWHFAHWSGGTPRHRYETGLNDIVMRIKEAGARVILCTPTVIGEKTDGTNEFDGMLNEYAEISRNVARTHHVELCDLRRAFIEYLQQHNQENKEEGILTHDSVHLTDAGNRLVASELLKLL